jgi:membrane-associated phospholipid phosphatase
MALTDNLRDLRPILLPFVVWLLIYSLIGTAVFVLLGKQEAHLWLNSWHRPYPDVFFKYITHLGHGAVPVILFHVLVLVRYGWALGLGISSLLMGFVVQFLKRSVFAGDHRPAMYFEGGMLPTIDGVDLMMEHSFPSGHAATAFCVFLMLAFFVKQRWATYTFLALALLTAFSRVYISQHFIQDTIVGSWIGLGFAALGYWFIVRPAEQDPASKLNGRLLP